MEPVDPRMGGLLDGGGAVGPDELRTIVSRAGRRRARLAAAAAGLALAAGGGIGYGVASATGGGSGQQIVATAPVSGPAGPSAAYGAAAGTPIAVSELQSLFTRQVGSIDIRGFLTSFPSPLPYQGMYACGFGGPGFQAEVSTPHMVGIVSGFGYQNSAAGPIGYSQPTLIGRPEGDPTLVVVVYTSSNVARVEMNLASGSSDQMAPVQGWSALAARTGGGTSSAGFPDGSVIAYDHTGKVLQSVNFAEIKPVIPPSRSGGVTGSGIAGSGTVHAAGGAVSSPPVTKSSSPSPTSSGTTSEAPANIAYPCRVPPGPASPPTCAPPTTVRGANYACATPLPTQICNQPAGAANATCVPIQTAPPSTNTATSPNSGSGG